MIKLAFVTVVVVGGASVVATVNSYLGVTELFEHLSNAQWITHNIALCLYGAAIFYAVMSRFPKKKKDYVFKV